jgi:hypothetical protein
MSASHTDHSTDEVVAHHDPAAEIAHAKEHAAHNIIWFAGFFTIVLFAVANYYCFGVTDHVGILFLAGLRSLLIACFFAYLIRHFSFVLRTFVFTFIFFLGMIFLSMWDSVVPTFGDPIMRPGLASASENALPVIPDVPAKPVPAAPPATP